MNMPIKQEPLNKALSKANDEEFSMTQELIYYGLTHPTEYNQEPRKFRVRKISHKEKLENLGLILEVEEIIDETRNRIGRLPTNKDVLNCLQSRHGGERTEIGVESLMQNVNALVEVIWILN